MIWDFMTLKQNPPNKKDKRPNEAVDNKIWQQYTLIYSYPYCTAC